MERKLNFNYDEGTSEIALHRHSRRPIRDTKEPAANDPIMNLTEDTEGTPLDSLHRSFGRRYKRCRFDNFNASTPAQRAALAKCRDYAAQFKDHVQEGHSLILIGPKGTGKDHLLCATITAIMERYSLPAGRIVYRDGLRLFAEFREAIEHRSHHDEGSLVNSLMRPHLFAVSDPLPPTGKLSEYEQRMWLRIVDGRYRELRAMAATINVSTRGELDDRMGSQAADRLCGDATVVACNWASYRLPNIVVA